MKKYDESTQIKYGSIISYALIILNVVLGLLYTPWILKEIGSSNYGLYTLASALTALFLMDFGMGAAVTRFIAKYRAEGDQGKINSFVGLSVKLYAILMIVISIVFLILFFNLETIYSNLTQGEISTFKIVFSIVAFFVVVCFPVNICNGILNAYEQFIYLKGADILNKVGTVVLTIILLTLHGDIYGLVFINGIFNLITFVVKYLLIRTHTPVKIALKESDLNGIKEILSFSLWSTVQSASQQMIFNLVPSVLAMVMNTTAITLYGFANVIEGYVYNISSAINGMFLPRISRLVVESEDTENILLLMIKVGRITLSITALLLIGLTSLGKEFVYIWVGDVYSDLYYCILLLAFPYFISATQIIANNSLVALNKVKFSAIINVVVGAFNIVGVYLIAPQYGIIGVCAITGIAFWLNILLSNIIYISVLKIDIFNFFKKCHLQMFPGITISMGIALVIQHFWPWSLPVSRVWQWGIFVVKIFIVSICFFVIMWMITWKQDEKRLIVGLIKKEKK